MHPKRLGELCRGVRHTIVGGIVFDAEQLRADVRAMVKQAWDEAGRTLEQPGVVPSED